MKALVIMTGFGDERKAFLEALKQTLATVGVEEIKTLPLLSAVKGQKNVIITLPRRHQIDPENFLSVLRAAHPDVEFTGLGVETCQQIEGEYPYLAVY